MGISIGFGGDLEANALIYGMNRNVGTMQYLETQINNATTAFSQTLTDAGKSFYSNAKDLFDKFNGSDAIATAKAAIRKAGGIFQGNEIQSIEKIEDFQTAPLIMQRYLAAEPTVRKMIQEQRCDGWSNTYFDYQPGLIGDDHYDYRRVMDGLITIDKDGEEKFTIYLDTLEEGDRDLRLDEQLDITCSWEHIAALMKYGSGEDPTSVEAGKL